ncbi:tRNA (adenine(58)-N(1))-methyltransferase, mitochondrial-like [Asterias amurensis]|uniref:tRNA (adenine(58)-N(1))-methyltransferase, mitochondrial-like n=1 Tax=Asterias amurensis TaxID=7602 RepID=UPI003AB456F9
MDHQSLMRLSLSSVRFLYYRIPITNQPINKVRFSHQVLQRALSSYSDEPLMVSSRQSQAHSSLLRLKMRESKQHLQHLPGGWRPPPGGYRRQGGHCRNQVIYRHFASDNSGHGDDKSSSSEDKEFSHGKMSYIEARKRGVIQGRRSLLPMERVGGMLETDLDGEEVPHQPPSKIVHDVQDEVSANLTSDSHSSTPLTDRSIGSTAAGSGGSAAMWQPATHHNSPPMIDGEMVIALRENFKRHEFLCRMFRLDAQNRFRCKYGVILHADIVGHQAGRTFSTDLDIDIMIRRPTLEEFVLYMRRTPVISYPKDCCTMLMMIDASPGDVILEAGTGSGAMTLFLSRAVGERGRVHSFEAREVHQKRAMKNINQWRSSWNVCHPEHHWPQNVSFHLGKLESRCKDLGPSLLVDGAVIDMERPYAAIPTLAERLKPGKSAVIYVANITQIIDIAEFLRVNEYPLTMERVLDVTHKAWVVNQARRHSGTSLSDPRLTVDPNSSDQSDGEDEGYNPLRQKTQYIEDDVPKYIARPHNNQFGHTAFLVSLRKIESSTSTYKM